MKNNEPNEGQIGSANKWLYTELGLVLFGVGCCLTIRFMPKPSPEDGLMILSLIVFPIYFLYAAAILILGIIGVVLAASNLRSKILLRKSKVILCISLLQVIVFCYYTLYQPYKISKQTQRESAIHKKKMEEIRKDFEAKILENYTFFSIPQKVLAVNGKKLSFSNGIKIVPLLGEKSSLYDERDLEKLEDQEVTVILPKLSVIMHQYTITGPPEIIFDAVVISKEKCLLFMDFFERPKVLKKFDNEQAEKIKANCPIIR